MNNLIHGLSVVIGFIVWKVTGQILIGAIAGFFSEGILWGIFWGISTLFSGKKPSEESNNVQPSQMKDHNVATDLLPRDASQPETEVHHPQNQLHNDANKQQAKAPAVACVEEKTASKSDVPQANNRSGQEDTKTRHGCLTTFLLFMIIGNAIISLLLAFFSDSMGISEEIKIVQILVSILMLICAVLVWKWQRIGFWGIVIISGLGFIGNLIAGEFLPAFQCFIPAIFLYAALSKEKDGVSGWKNLEYAKKRVKSVPDSASITAQETNNAHTKRLNPIPEEPKKQHIVLVHKVSSSYHIIGEEQKITGNYVEIGRDPKCQVRYDENFETVSRRHAAIMKDDNQWKLLPLSRTNPTFINGQMVQKEWFLHHDDEIQCAVNGPKLVFRLSTNGL